MRRRNKETDLISSGLKGLFTAFLRIEPWVQGEIEKGSRYGITRGRYDAMRGFPVTGRMKGAALCSAVLIGMTVAVISFLDRPTLLVNAHILTMDMELPVADALLMKGGLIMAVGSRASLEQDMPLMTRIVDLGGRSVLPGFVDAHSHFPSAGLARTFLDLTPPPVGDVGSLDTLLRRVAEYAASRPAGKWVVGFNYDDASLGVQRHPTRAELDRVAPHHPVYLWHRSGHMGVANSIALAEFGHKDRSDADFSDTEHGSGPGRDHQGRLTGLLQEEASPRLSRLLMKLPLRDLLNALLTARDMYLQAGMTTVQNGFADLPSMRLLRWSQRLGILPQRVVVWPAFEKIVDRLNMNAIGIQREASVTALQQALDWKADQAVFSLSALKMSVDGSPQGRTAWLTQPYRAADDKVSGYRGFPTVQIEMFKTQVLEFHKAGINLALHGNGDAAIDLIIEALEEAQLQYFRPESRHILVHAQTIRENQLPRLKSLGASVSFFPSHTFFWGDWYRETILGEERARMISPLALADAYQLPYTLHSDAPVTPVNPMQTLWSATRRETLSGFVLGPEFAISRERALRAMTLDAAWQNNLDKDRGSLEVGKLADIVVLSGNPLREPDVRNLKVERVWIGGRDVYTRIERFAR